jgi:DNA-binding SARP family transcriptional activator/streptogramin lyase
MIDYRILGPLEVSADGRVIDIGGPKQRALLAILLLHANESVPRGVLVHELWGERPPPGAQGSLDVYMSRLRKALGAAGNGQAVVTRPGGYCLQLADGLLDVHRFERLVTEGRSALAGNAPEQAAASLREALALWRGNALGDLNCEPFAQVEAGRLEELRLGAAEDRIEADLALGRHADLVSELEALVATYPLRERLHGQLMIALYRCGRQAEALEAYQAARRTLVEELGLEPGPALQRLERAILQQDTSLELASTATAATGGGPAGGPGQSPLTGPHRTRRLMAVAVAVAVAIALLAAVTARGRAPVAAGPNTVGVIDSGQDRLSAVVTGVGRPDGIAYGAGAVWVTDSADNMLLRVNSARQVIDRIPVGHGPAGITVADGEIWVANELDGTVSEVNPGAGRQVATIRVGNGPVAIASGFRSVWVANFTDSTLSRIDPGSGRLVATLPLGSAPAGLAAGQRGIWVTSTDTGQLALVDPRTNRLSRAVWVGGAPVGVAVGGGNVWVADSSGAVARYDPISGHMRRFKTGGSPSGIAYADAAVWVADSHGGSVVRIDPHTGSARAIGVGNQPTTLTAAGRDVLATVLPSPATHRGGTLTLIANLAPYDQATDPAVAYMIPIWQMLGVTNDGLVGYRRIGGTAGDTLVPDLSRAPCADRQRPDLHLPPPARHPVLHRGAGAAGGLPARGRAGLPLQLPQRRCSAVCRHRRSASVRANPEPLRPRAGNRQRRPGRHDHFPPHRA